jgi:hypothetical protein
MNPAAALRALRDAETRLACARLIIRYKRADIGATWHRTHEERMQMRMLIRLEDKAQEVERHIVFLAEQLETLGVQVPR